MSRRVNASHLSSKIIGGRDGEKEEYSYMASLQVNEMHICGAGMFQPGFLISSAQCLDEMMKRLKFNLRRGSAVIGHPYLTKGERCDILGLKVHPNFNTSKILEKIRNYDVGVVMVSILTIFNFFINAFIIHRLELYQHFFLSIYAYAK